MYIASRERSVGLQDNLHIRNGSLVVKLVQYFQR